jgi:hypothetical protein
MLKTAIIACAICTGVGGTVIWNKTAVHSQDTPLVARPASSPNSDSMQRIVPADVGAHELGWGPVRATDW